MVHPEERMSPNSVKAVQSDETKRAPESTWMFWKMRRYVVALLAFLGFCTSYALRVNLSIAIVAMTEFKNTTLDNGTVIQVNTIIYTLGFVYIDFIYLIGGYLAARIGGKRVFGTGIAVTAVLTLVTPWVAQTNFYLLIVVRIIEGIFEFGLCFTGTVGIIWCILWMVIVTDSPEEDSKISEYELNFITSALNEESKSNKKANSKIPWRSFATSMPVWAITVSHFSENWGFYTLLTQLPKFMKGVLDMKLNAAGFLSALPYLAMAIMTQFSGHLADWFLVKGILTTTQVRRTFNCSGFVAQTVFMMTAAYWLHPVGTTFCLTMAVGLGAFAWAGFSINHLDIAPQYASILMGFGNTFATIPGIVSPILTGYIVTDETSISEWRVVFFISSGIYLFGAVFYGTFVSGELQPWAVETQSLKTDLERYEDKNRTSRQTHYENKSFKPDSDYS
nr:sialin-like [Leptinotarsa decemlineata]